MTSKPASRKARATTRAPRSWPSRPGLATSIRSFLSVSMETFLLNESEDNSIASAQLESPGIGINPKNIPVEIAAFLFCGPSPDRLDERWHDVVFPAWRTFASAPQLVHCFAKPDFVALILEQAGATDLHPFDFVVYLQHEFQLRPVGWIFVHPDYDFFSGLDLLLEMESRIGDFHLRVVALYGRNHPAQFIELADVGVGFFFHLIGKGLDKIGACQRVYHVRDSALVSQYLLRAQSDQHRLLAWNHVDLIKRIGMQRLGAPENRRQGFSGGTDDVV